MVERITSSTRYNMLIADMKMNEFNFNKLTAQLSSGRKIIDITDDPIASVNILKTSIWRFLFSVIILSTALTKAVDSVNV